MTVEGGPVTGLELRLDKAAEIRGRILGLAPGERAEAVWASAGANAGRREGQLDQEGGFVIPGLPPGDWTVTVLHGGREISQSLHVGPDQETEWIDLDLDSQAVPD